MSDTSTDNTTYYYSNGQRIPLAREPDAYAVRFRAGEKSDSSGLSAEARTLLRSNSQHLGFVPNHNLQIYRLTPGAAAAGAMAAPPTKRLEAEPAVEFAAPVFRRGQTGDIMLVTRQFVAQFKAGVAREQIDTMNAQHQVRIVSALDYAPNGYILEAPAADGPTGPVALANAYYESGLTEFSQPDLIKKHYWRTATAAPPRVAAPSRAGNVTVGTARDSRNVYQSQQWHLTSANIIDAWSVTRGEPSIKVCILDDGVDVGHPEFAGKIVAQFDFYRNCADATPKGGQDNHGTACAGVATAAGAKALGAAPGCSLIAGVTPAWNASTEEAKMFKWAADQGADVISCSWGPPDGTGAVDPLPDATRVAIRYCVTQGRNGKGCAVLFAAGNGNESVSNDGYASNPDVMAIAACTDADQRSWYSDMGPELCICAPSNGGSKSILTTDRRGADGYNKTHPGQDDPSDPAMTDPFADLDYTSTFGGTSSATPLVAGVVGLMLSANPSLTVGQIRQCLQNTAVKIGGASAYDSIGHSTDFGYGKVNAGAAVREAQRVSGGGGTSGGGSSQSLPTISATQASIPRSGSAPTFQVDPRPNTHYAVEVGARSDLLDADGGQPADEYYASWEDTALTNAPTFTLPAHAWDRLKHHPRLLYRVWATASSTEWVNTLASTGDAGAAAAASIEIVEQGGSSGGAGPTIQGPSSVSATDVPPTFTVDPTPNAFYAVEFAARPELLDADGGQPTNEYYATWEDSALLNGSTYTMSSQAWDRLKGNARLYYRAWTTSSGSEWADTVATAETGAAAASMEISSADRSRTSRGAPTGGPTITGPETANTAGAAPEFRITTPTHRYFAVEVAVDRTLLDGRRERDHLPASDFYASWMDGTLRAESAVTAYTLPAKVWEAIGPAALQRGGRLYYRVITTSVPDAGWPGLQTSLPDEQFAEAPGIDVWHRPGRDAVGGETRPEEVLWKK